MADQGCEFQSNCKSFTSIYFLIFFIKDFIYYLFIYLFVYLFMWVREHEQGEWQREREKQTPCWAGSPKWGSIPGPWDHDPSWRQTLNHLSHPGTPSEFYKNISLHAFLVPWVLNFLCLRIPIKYFCVYICAHNYIYMCKERHTYMIYVYTYMHLNINLYLIIYKIVIINFNKRNHHLNKM